MSELFLNVVNMGISASWVVLAVLLLRLFLKKAPKWVSVLLWGMVGIRLICPFSLESVCSLIPSGETLPGDFGANPTFTINSGIPFIDGRVNGFLSDRYYEGVTVPANYAKAVTDILCVVWLVGIFLMLLYAFISYLRLRQRVREAVREDGFWHCDRILTPFVLGVLKPRIYLPFSLAGAEAESVLAHEQTHLCRKDHLWKPLGFLLLTLHWFNPLMWLGYYLLCRDIEFACDERVIRSLDANQRAVYSQTLLSCSVNRRMIAVCPLAFGEVGVKERVKTVLNYKKPAFWLILVSLLVVTVTAVCLLTDPTGARLRNIEYLDLSVVGDNTVSLFRYDGERFLGIADFNEDLIDELLNLRISKEPITQSRSEDRDRTNTLVLHSESGIAPSADSGIHICLNHDFTAVWVDTGVKPTLSYRVLHPKTAQRIYEELCAFAGVGDGGRPTEPVTFEIIDETRLNPNIATNDALEGFYRDSEYCYYFPSIKSYYVYVLYPDGTREGICEAMEKGIVTVADLDRFGIGYIKETLDGEFITQQPDAAPKSTVAPEKIDVVTIRLFDGAPKQKIITDRGLIREMVSLWNATLLYYVQEDPVPGTTLSVSFGNETDFFVSNGFLNFEGAVFDLPSGLEGQFRKYYQMAAEEETEIFPGTLER